MSVSRIEFHNDITIKLELTPRFKVTCIFYIYQTSNFIFNKNTGFESNLMIKLCNFSHRQIHGCQTIEKGHGCRTMKQ